MNETPPPAVDGDADAHFRVRRAMYFAFALLASLAVAQALYAFHVGQARALGVAALAISEPERVLWLGAAITLATLGGLALAVVEPTARAVRSRVQRLAQQAAELEQLALVAGCTDSLVVIADARARIEWVNPAFERTSALALAQVRGRALASLLRDPLASAAAADWPQALLAAGTGRRLELELQAGPARMRCIETDVRVLKHADGTVRGLVAVGIDTTERRALHERLQASARTDALTGLPNRVAVLERVERAVEHARRHPEYGFAVLFMDFDRFKQVNDTLGHGAGDELLRQIAQRLVGALRPGDAIARVLSERGTAARLGGDEFVVVLEGIHTAADALAVGERLRGELARPYALGAQLVHSSASIGIVTSAQGAQPAELLLRDADTAMYEAKRAGRNRCVQFDASMHERVAQALALESDLRRALRERELFLVYQPVVDLATGIVAGVEALVRWRHPARGVVPPAQFIGVAEETGLITEIGDFVLQTACRQFARWRCELGERAPRLLAVNLSRAQLEVAGIVPEIGAALAANGLDAAELQLEITESLAAQSERVQLALRELKTMGVKLALDDFGTGYSSLACLHQLPVDTVKIDRSFVAHAADIDYHRVLIEATIRVAQTLGMTTVAEGIETPGQAELMDALRCDRGQGYHFSRPLPAAEFADWVRRAEPRIAV